MIRLYILSALILFALVSGCAEKSDQKSSARTTEKEVRAEEPGAKSVSLAFVLNYD